MGKLKIELNDIQNIRDLLQEAYKLADEQIVQSQNEINKLSSATNLHEEAMDAKAKYAKSINDYLSIKDKAIAKKLDIAKLLSDILSHNGDVKGAIENGSAMKNMSINFDDIRKIVDDSLNEQEKTKTIQLNKK
jgi:predicted  nucleic acid-binding Zn-ribbon protein